MGLLGKVFGNTDVLSKVRKAVREKRWADALIFGEGVSRKNLDTNSIDELDSFVRLAKEQLAVINIAEGEACLRSGNFERAEEHFSLASEHALSESLLNRIDILRNGNREKNAASVKVPPPSGKTFHEASCGCDTSCSSGKVMMVQDDFAMGRDEMFELLLETYPPELKARYTECSRDFKDAILLAHEGRDSEALDSLAAISEDSRDDLFYFERGTIFCRLGNYEEGRRDIEKALNINPGNRHIFETLVDAELEFGASDRAERRLQSVLNDADFSGFSHSRLASLYAARGLLEKAIVHGKMALERDPKDQQMLLLCASLLERNGLDDEAEAFLLRLPGHGCSSGISLPLAEFSLRKGKRLDKALESFKGALRGDPENPRWLVRIAQVYLARGWRKEGIELLKQVVIHPSLDDSLRHEIAAELGESAR